MVCNQNSLQETVRGLTGTSYDFNSDWHALFDLDGIATGDFNGRLLAWINAVLSATHTDINAAKAAFAIEQGFADWNSMNTFEADTGSPDLLWSDDETLLWSDDTAVEW